MSTSEWTCEVCKKASTEKNPVSQYEFHYGRHEKSQDALGFQVASYSVAPLAQTARLCHSCTSPRRRIAKGSLIALGIVVLLFYGPVLVAGLTQGFDQDIANLAVYESIAVGVIILMVGPFILIRWLRVAKTPLKTWGERRAIKLHRKALKKQGFDRCWTTEEYRELAEGSGLATSMVESAKAMEDLWKKR